MSNPVKQGNHKMDLDTISSISKRYKTITKAVNRDFWNSSSEIAHSRYVGSYGRGTAINTSDLDVLIELPDSEYERFASSRGNGPSRLLQAVKNAILETYPRTDVKGDGQVVVVNFSDGMKFEILPAFVNHNWWENGKYKYPDTHMGGNWMSTDPLAEQEAMKIKNDKSNGLLFETCKHIRYVRAENFSSYHLSGILVDSFVYAAIGDWRFPRAGETLQCSGPTYEEYLFDRYENMLLYPNWQPPILRAPGSGMEVVGDDWEVLEKVLKKMV